MTSHYQILLSKITELELAIRLAKLRKSQTNKLSARLQQISENITK
jgi:hypothetical protein